MLFLKFKTFDTMESVSAFVGRITDRRNIETIMKLVGYFLCISPTITTSFLTSSFHTSSLHHRLPVILLRYSLSTTYSLSFPSFYPLHRSVSLSRCFSSSSSEGKKKSDDTHEPLNCDQSQGQLTEGQKDQKQQQQQQQQKQKQKPKPIVIDEKDIVEKFVKGSGPGGQSVNKSANRVQLTHLPTGITISCHEQRDLTTNRKIARRKLREQLDLLINGKESKISKKQDKLKKQKAKRKRQVIPSQFLFSTSLLTIHRRAQKKYGTTEEAKKVGKTEKREEEVDDEEGLNDNEEDEVGEDESDDDEDENDSSELEEENDKKRR